MIVAGIDPGSVTGAVVMDVPDAWHIQGARWLAAQTFRPCRASQISTEALRDVHLYDSLVRWLANLGVVEAAIEVAAEAKIVYRGRRKQATETAHRAGMYCQLAVLAAHEAGAYVHTYPAVTSKARGPGWMGTAPRHALRPGIAAVMQHTGAPAEYLERDDSQEFRQHHIADAVGVLSYHVNQQAQLRIREVGRALVRASA